MSDFSRTLGELRGQAGYETPRSFFNGLGGRPFFCCTYKQYANVEAGRSLPGPSLVGKIAVGLRLAIDGQARRGFARSYLRALLGNQELFEFIIHSLHEGRSSGQSPTVTRRAVDASFKARAHRLTQEQTDAISATLESQWAFTILSNDTGLWGPHDVAKLTGLSEPGLRKSMKKLSDLRIFSEREPGRYSCPLAGKTVLHARKKFGRVERRRAVSRNWKAMAEKKGEDIQTQNVLLRASEADLRGYLPDLIAALKGLSLYNTIQKGPDTALIHVEFVVRKVLPF